MPTNENYIVIQGFMTNELGLKGNELLCYAIIYGFSQDGESEFTGSISYLRFWLGTTKRNVISVLQNLVDKGLIIKNDRVVNNLHLPTYKADLGMCKNVPTGEKISPPGEKISPNNIDNNIDTTKKEINKERKFVVPTVEEIRAYCEERNNGIDPQYFWAFYDAKGWKIGKEPMKSWKSAVITWELKNKSKQQKTTTERDYSDFYL